MGTENRHFIIYRSVKRVIHRRNYKKCKETVTNIWSLQTFYSIIQSTQDANLKGSKQKMCCSSCSLLSRSINLNDFCPSWGSADVHWLQFLFLILWLAIERAKVYNKPSTWVRANQRVVVPLRYLRQQLHQWTFNNFLESRMATNL